MSIFEQFNLGADLILGCLIGLVILMIVWGCFWCKPDTTKKSDEDDGPVNHICIEFTNGTELYLTSESEDDLLDVLYWFDEEPKSAALQLQSTYFSGATLYRSDIVDITIVDEKEDSKSDR